METINKIIEAIFLLPWAIVILLAPIALIGLLFQMIREYWF